MPKTSRICSAIMTQSTSMKYEQRALAQSYSMLAYSTFA